jgi:pyrimidine operon attenuation protein/uracil phosphoribosyltransferase
MPVKPSLPLPDAEAQCAELAACLRPHFAPGTALIGIFSGGAWIAERVAQLLGSTEPVGLIDVSFYRDDFEKIGLHPKVRPTAIPFPIDGRPILLFDDVLHTGRTTRAALNVIFDFGRPAKVELAVLADRGGRELPVAPRWCVWDVAPASDEVLILDRADDGRLSWRIETVPGRGHA